MPPERTTETYSPEITAASKSVLLELMTILRSYREALVLVGGWVPYFLLEKHRRPGDSFVHVGSIDIDLAVDPSKISEDQYATIVELIQERGYRPAPDKLGVPVPNCFERIINSPAENKSYKIRVDFLTHQHDLRQGEHRHLPVQDDLLARKTKGCEVAFQHNTDFDLEGELPEGGRIKVQIHMADLVGCLAMKGIVLGERYKGKDAYDIYVLMAHYKNGPRDVADEIRPHLLNQDVNDAVNNIRSAFATREANGPAWVAAFFPVISSDERERLITAILNVIHEFFDVLLFNPAASPRSPQPPSSKWDEKWIEKHRAVAREGLKKIETTGFMEVRFALSEVKPNRLQRELLESAQQAQIHTFGWPIGVVMTREEYRPRPRTDGIVAEIVIASKIQNSYDYWALRNNGDFYLLKSLFEDEKKSGSIFFDTRIIRITETLMYCRRLYSKLGVPDSNMISLGIRHGGLKGRVLRSANRGRYISIHRSASEDECISEINVPIGRLESDLISLVKEFTKPLFVLFDFFELSDSIYAEIITNFFKGKVV